MHTLQQGLREAAASQTNQPFPAVRYCLLKKGTVEEKRHVLLNLRSRLVLQNGVVYLDAVSQNSARIAQEIAQRVEHIRGPQK